MRSGPIRVSPLVQWLCLLLCIGLAGCHKAHSVTLTWQAPVTVQGVTIVGYNVYRKPDYGGAFVKIASRVSGPSYEDHLVIDGRTYIYAVTAIDQAGRESSFSREVRATIP